MKEEKEQKLVERNITVKNKIQIEDVKKTPFKIVKQNENYFIVFGNVKIDKNFKRKWKAKRFIRKNNWEMSCAIAQATYYAINNNNNNKK